MTAPASGLRVAEPPRRGLKRLLPSSCLSPRAARGVRLSQGLEAHVAPAGRREPSPELGLLAHPQGPSLPTVSTDVGCWFRWFRCDRDGPPPCPPTARPTFPLLGPLRLSGRIPGDLLSSLPARSRWGPAKGYGQEGAGERREGCPPPGAPCRGEGVGLLTSRLPFGSLRGSISAQAGKNHPGCHLLWPKVGPHPAPLGGEVQVH